jgi:hypothetical protein
MRCLTTGILSDKCIVRGFRHCTNFKQCTYTNLESTVTPTTHLSYRYSLLLLGYKPVQHVTVLNTVGNCNTMVHIIILYYNLKGPPSYMRSAVDQNTVMQSMTACFLQMKTPGRNICMLRYHYLMEFISHRNKST